MLEQLVQQWKRPDDFWGRLQLFVRTLLFQTDFIFAAYFMDWWETVLLYLAYTSLLGLVLYSAFRQGAHAWALAEPVVAPAAARLGALLLGRAPS